jgi:hypothetical protein
MSDAAAKKVRLDARPPNEEELDRAERHLALGFSMPDSEGAEAGSTSTGLFDDAVDTGGEDPVPQTPVPTAPVPPKRRRRGWEA